MKIVWDRVLNLTVWVLQVLLTLMFLYFGASKLRSDDLFWIAVFAKIGIGQWFRYFTGVLEVVCAVMLLVPRTSGIAAALLACTMAGAVLAHLLVIHDGYASIFPGFPLLILVAIAVKRRSALFTAKGNST